VEVAVNRRWNVNGQEIEVTFNSGDRLLDVLRNDLGLMGAKEGCGEGECGACSVLINGELKLSCLQLAAVLSDGTAILTAEGIENTRQGPLLQETANRNGAVQCGYCTPGMMVAMYWLMEHPKIPAGQGLSGNLCRCTGYKALIDTVDECRRILAGKKDGDMT